MTTEPKKKTSFEELVRAQGWWKCSYCSKDISWGVFHRNEQTQCPVKGFPREEIEEKNEHTV